MAVRSIHDVVGQHIVDLLELSCMSEAVSGGTVASAYGATLIRQGLMQQNPVPARIMILVNPNDPDDISAAPQWMDEPVSTDKDDRWRITTYEIGGGQRWWRKFTIDIYVFLIRTQEDRDEAREVGLQMASRVQHAIFENPSINLSDDFGELAIAMWVAGLNPFEGGGPPRSFIWHAKMRVRVLTEQS